MVLWASIMSIDHILGEFRLSDALAGCSQAGSPLLPSCCGSASGSEVLGGCNRVVAVAEHEPVAQ